MANRVKEDEKNERIIRNLLRLPENRRCINCNSLGPQYVCTNFSTFICTTCSGIHREFTHRVKSVSMAKFTSLEVSALQGGGNASAREIYLKGWDSQRNSLPDGRNIEKLRDFIKHVYVDRRFTSERSPDNQDKSGETKDFNSTRGIDNYQRGPQSPPYDDRFDRNGDRSSSGGRSPGYDAENQPRSDHRRSPGMPDVVNDWRREDRFANGRRSEDRSSDGVRSPVSEKDSELSSPPVVRPVRDILGDIVSPLRVIEPQNATGAKATDTSLRTQRNQSSSSLASSDANPSEIKVDTLFIDFDSAPEPAKMATVPQIQQVKVDESSVQLTPSSSNDWADFDSVNKAASHTESSAIPGLSDKRASASSYGSTTAPSALPPTGVSSSVGPTPQFSNVQPSYLSNAAFPASVPQVVRPVTSDKAWNSPAQIAQDLPGPSALPGTQHEVNSAMGNPAALAKGSLLESKSSGRKALPEDLFSMNYSYGPSPAPGWYPGSQYIPGFPMQYSTPAASWHGVNQLAAARSINPFEVSHEPSSGQASAFPSLGSLQGALPRTVPGLNRASSLGAPLPGSMSMHTQAPVYTSPIPQRSFSGQDLAGSFPPRPQILPGLSSEASAFPSFNPNLQHPAHSASSNVTSSGNPFG